eukprot:TRINITY_DN6242_c0_g1_i2.p1 TRINITY_DN6242_c0_g1~~TRINITY_DN6242_c0_g1_i2.p1  ORF type:complete len:201 (+),score=25.71 TRINITY_DN6242_c0_g1_i2:205-807(+)
MFGNLKPLVVSGLPGTGKTSLLLRLLSQYPKKFEFAIAHTTRLPFSGEVNGSDYYFIDPKEFDNMIKDNAFLEYEQVHSFLYGTSLKEINRITKMNHIPMVDIDIRRALHFKTHNSFKHVNFFIIMPPSIEILQRRLLLRVHKKEDREHLHQRITEAEMAVENVIEAGKIDKENIIVNDEIETAYQSFLARLRGYYEFKS